MFDMNSKANDRKAADRWSSKLGDKRAKRETVKANRKIARKTEKGV